MALSLANKQKKPTAAADSPRVLKRNISFKSPRVIASACTAFVLLACVSALFVFSSAYTRIFPNISAFGVDLGGKTVYEAQYALAEQFHSVYAGQSLDVTLDGQTINISIEDAAVELSTSTADRAFMQGRTGGSVSRAFFALTSLFSSRDLESAIDIYIDRDAILQRVIPLSRSSNQPPVEFDWAIGDTEISVVRGFDGRTSDPASIADEIVARFLSFDFSPLDLTTNITPPSPFPLEQIHAEVSVEPADAAFALDGDRRVAFSPHVVGLTFDLELAEEELNNGDSPEFIIPLIRLIPETTTDMFEASFFRDLLGEFSTNFSGSSANRVNNITLTTVAIDGVVLMPGDIFSFNEVVGRRTAERGYRAAGGFLHGQLVQMLGGGICQSSSTLYNAAMYANLEIVERQGHSRPVSYVPLGRDATVSYGLIDFRFANDTPFPIRVNAWVEGRNVHFQIWGERTDDLTVSIENTVISRNPSSTIQNVNPNLAPGTRRTVTSGSTGWTVQTYRILRSPDGALVYRNPEARTVHRRIDTVVEVGPEVSEEELPYGGTPPQEEPNHQPPYQPQPSPPPQQPQPSPPPPPPEPSPPPPEPPQQQPSPPPPEQPPAPPPEQAPPPPEVMPPADEIAA